MGKETCRYEVHEPFLVCNVREKFNGEGFNDPLILISHQGAGDYYSILSDSNGEHKKVLTADDKKPFRCREFALIASLTEFPENIPRYHTNGEFPPDKRFNAVTNLEYVAMHGISSEFVDKKALLLGVSQGFIEHKSIADAQKQYRSRSLEQLE